MGEQVAGTLTFVFTDIEGSTRRWQRFGDAMRDALERHDSLVADAIEGAGGRIFKHTGDGVCAVFGSAGAAVAAAVDIQRRVAAGDWDAVDGLAVRVGLHTGEATVRDGDYFGPALNRAARVMAAAHGGQVLLSNATAALVGPALGDGDVTVIDLGEHELRDLDLPERLHQAAGAGLRSDFPPPRVDRRPAARTGGGRLPIARTAFVGRAAEIDAVGALLDDTRLVTLVGIGGTGKTRLAVEVARCVGDRFDVVGFVDLAPITDGTTIPAAIASALGVAVAGGPSAGSVLDAVVGALTARRHLVVLDNCEHLVDDCAELVDTLLDATDVTILATSREALAVEGEHPWPVGSLPADDAVALFVDRAGAADPRVDVTSAAARGAVEEICRRLDGIPLAIELAASRVAHLSPHELASRLDDRFRLLTGGRNRRAQRQQTLQAAIDWSHDLLDDVERALLRRLSVFVGGFTLDAAEEVCSDDDGTPLPRRRVVDVLGGLVAKSLVLAEPSTPATRYRLLETIRLYAADRLVDAGEAERVRDRNAAWWSEWLRTFRPDDLATDLEVIAAVEREIDNLRAAVDWSAASGDARRAAELTAATPGLWAFRGHHEEGIQRLSDAAAADGLDDVARARCLAALSQSAMAAGDFGLMADAATRSLALDPAGPLAALALVYLALSCVFDLDRYPEAHRLSDEARRVADLHGARRLRQLADGNEAHFFVVEGDYERVIGLGRASPSQPTFADLNLRLATHAAHLLRGEPEAALGQARLLEVVWPEWMQSQVALALLDLGDRAGARAAALRGARLFLEQPYPLLIADLLVAFAALALDEGDAARCASILAATVAERGLASFRSPSIAMLSRRYLREARTRLADDEYAAARAAGRAVGSLTTFHDELARLGTAGGG